VLTLNKTLCVICGGHSDYSACEQVVWICEVCHPGEPDGNLVDKLFVCWVLHVEAEIECTKLVAAGLRDLMATTYGNPRINGAEYRDSLRSANSASVYSTDSGSYLDSSPLDSIIRDYPAVPGTSSNAFKYPSVTYGSSPMTAESSSSRFQRPQQQPRGAEIPSRLREYSHGDGQCQCFLYLFAVFAYKVLIQMPIQLPE
jgi:hypothetical protein